MRQAVFDYEGFENAYKNLPTKFSYLVEGKFPSAGKAACIRGMKKQFWGNSAICVKCRGYVYYLGNELNAENSHIYYLAR